MTTTKEVYTDLLMQCTRDVFQAGHMSTDYEVSWEGYKERVKLAVQILNPSVPAVLVEMAVDAIAKEERQGADDDDRLPFEP